MPLSRKLILDESQQNVGFTYPGQPNQHHLEHVVVILFPLLHNLNDNPTTKKSTKNTPENQHFPSKNPNKITPHQQPRPQSHKILE